MSLANQLRELVDAFSALVAEHVRLARMELSEDAKFIGLRVGLIAALSPLLLVGYGFLCVALALALRRVMAADLAFLVVGVLNLGVGGIGLGVALRQLSQRKVLGSTTAEFERTQALVLPENRGPTVNQIIKAPPRSLAPVKTAAEARASVAAARQRLHERLSDVEHALSPFAGLALAVKRHPLVAIGGAFLIGYAISKLFPRKR